MDKTIGSSVRNLLRRIEMLQIENWIAVMPLYPYLESLCWVPVALALGKIVASLWVLAALR